MGGGGVKLCSKVIVVKKKKIFQTQRYENQSGREMVSDQKRQIPHWTAFSPTKTIFFEEKKRCMNWTSEAWVFVHLSQYSNNWQRSRTMDLLFFSSMW